MNQSEEDLDMEAVRMFLRDQETKLKSDKLTLSFEGPKSDSDNSLNCMTNSNLGTSVKNGRLGTKVQNQPFSFNNDYRENNKMVKNRPVTSIPRSPREEEKEKLINILSQSKAGNLGTKKITNTARVSKINNSPIVNDAREEEKDRLAAIFASSSYRNLKPSNHEISKNLNSLLAIKSNENRVKKKPGSLPATKKDITTEEGDSPDNTALIDNEKSLRNKYNIPEISVSEYYSDSSHPDSTIQTARGRSVVRMGEFSPNRNHPGRPPVLGVGECDERRKLMMEQSRRDFQEYSRQQAEDSQGKSTRESRENVNHNHHLQNVATQTEWESEPIGLFLQETQMSQSLSPCPKAASHCVSPLPHTVSPTQLCYKGLSEKEVKEQMYREELKRQIQEKNRLKEEIKRKEEEEEAKIEAKIQRDLEKMSRQYEEERLQRLELAIRKKEQDDFLRQRLAIEQEKSLLECQEKKKELMKKKSVPSKNISPRKRSEPRFVSFSQSLPTNCASNALADVHETLRQPLLEIQAPQPSTSPLPTSSNTAGALNQLLSRSPSPPIHSKSSRDIDVLVRKTVFDPKLVRSASQQTVNKTRQNVNEKLREVDRLLREPLLPQSQSFQVLPPVSPPLLHATVPPGHPSRSPPIPSTKRRTNAEILDDKWKVPYNTIQNTTADDVMTRHNRSMLTQLGAFRRHLQQEKLRMEQRVVDDSP